MNDRVEDALIAPGHYFVGGVGTEIGKTYFSAELLRYWRGLGHPVHALKPVMSGFDDADLQKSDAGLLLQAMDRPVTPQSVDEICLHRFEDPLAPNIAMRQAGILQDYEKILDFTQKGQKAAGQDSFLIEGAGGIMSPLTDDKLQLDFMKDMGLPVLLVAAAYLGGISHALTALTALDHAGLETVKIIVTQPDAGPDRTKAFTEELNRLQSVQVIRLSHGISWPKASESG